MENYAYSAGVDMKEHFCPVEKTLFTYEGQCNWCGESEESMKQDEIIEMAREAGFKQPEGETWYEAFPQCIEAFAKLIAAKERETCAKLCEDDINSFKGAYYLANKIRARGDKA